MRIIIVTLFPEMFSAVTECGVSGRATRRDILQVETINPRDFVSNRHQTVDDRPFGGGPGMVMMYQPLNDAITKARTSCKVQTKVAYMSPQGQQLNQTALTELAKREELILVCGRYEGIDERLINTQIDEEWSLGDYVLSGGELAAMAIIDGVARLLPGALGHEDSAAEDSFSAELNGLLDTPHYTRPETVDALQVPDVLLSGNHQAIQRWRNKQALGRTWLRRPELLDDVALDAEQQDLLNEFIREHKSAKTDTSKQD